MIPIILALLSLSPISLEDEAVSPERSHVQQIQERGYLWVRCFPQQISPFLAVNTEKGAMPTEAGPDRFRGVDIDILKLVAEELGVRLRIHPGTEPTILSSFELLEKGYGDVVGGGLTITASRQKRFAFSQPYFDFVDLVLEPATLKEARRHLNGSRLAVIPGSSFDEAAQAVGIAAPLITYYEFIGEAYESVALGTNDFTFADSTMLGDDNLLGVAVAYQFRNPRGYGFAIPKNSDLKTVFDRVLSRLQETGGLERILQKYAARGSADLTSVPKISWQDFIADW